jgi:transcriptional regulator with XRE-family HTH domain
MFDAHSEAELLHEVRCAVAHRNLTYEKLARRLGHSSHTNLSAIFNGRTRLSVPMLFRIADAIDMDISFSLSRREDIPGAVVKYPQPKAERLRPGEMAPFPSSSPDDF